MLTCQAMGDRISLSSFFFFFFLLIQSSSREFAVLFKLRFSRVVIM